MAIKLPKIKKNHIVYLLTLLLSLLGGNAAPSLFDAETAASLLPSCPPAAVEPAKGTAPLAE